MNTVIVIPARYGSTRFPGKPMANILGKTLLERTWLIAQAVQGVDAVIIATDDQKIVEHATAFGAQVQLTSSQWRNGSERVLEALQLLKLSPSIVVNLQGDAVLTPPFVIEELVKVFSQKNNNHFALGTPCIQLTKIQYQEIINKKDHNSTHGTMVTFDQEGKALYFSRALIPSAHNKNALNNIQTVPAYRHIGLYAFRYSTLEEYLDLSPTPLELLEGLEQLRALEHGWPIKVVPVDYRGRTHWSVDHPSDIEIVEKIIKSEGELVGVAI